jgi:hypothetical protein
MKTLPKLTLATGFALLLGSTPLLAGPGGNTPVYRAPRETTMALVAPKKCDRMSVNRNEKLGGNSVVACTKAVKQTAACVLACR